MKKKPRNEKQSEGIYLRFSMPEIRDLKKKYEKPIATALRAVILKDLYKQ